MRRFFAAAACVFVAVAQQTEEVRVSAHVYTPPQLRLTAQAQLVQLEVVVRDQLGRAVSGLKQSDFEILDEGSQRPIAAFSVETRAPAPLAVQPAAAAPLATLPSARVAAPAPIRSTLLFFDDLHASGGELQRTQAAARRFVKDGLGPGARAAVYAASEGLTLDFTDDADALTAAIEKLRSHQRMSENGLQPCPRITPYQAYLIVNNLDPLAYNAALAEANQCSNATIGAGPAPGVMVRGPGKGGGMIPTNPTAINVRAQAEATWGKARDVSLTSFDAIEDSLTRLAREPGTRVLLMVSTGFLSGMMDAERAAAIDRAIHAGIVINALDAKGLWADPPRTFGNDPQTYKGFPLTTFIFESTSNGALKDAVNDVMAEFAAGTGGLFFHNTNDLAGGFAALAAVPETTYLLAFRPDPENQAGKYRKLKVRLTAGTAGYAQARPGYFAPAKAPAKAEEARRKLDQEALGADELTGIPVQLGARLGKTDKGAPTLSLLIHVDLAKLKFTPRDGRQTQKLEFIGALMDANGNMVTAKEGAMELALKPDTMARLTASGVNAALTLSAPPGPYRVRVVVQDAEGAMAALTQKLQIP